MTRILLKIEYLGTDYHGWQRQADFYSVQEAIETALLAFLHEPITIVAAGRTDRGVHASGQIVHFDTTKTRSMTAYVFGLNHFLPSDIRVLEAREVAADFHARFDAVYRQYQMRIFNRPVAPATLSGRVLWHPVSLDVQKMQAGATHLLGLQDFSSFRGKDCQAKSPLKTLNFCEVSRQGEWVLIDIQGSGFLHNMVRNITGVLLKIGEGQRPPIWAQAVLAAKAREAAAKTVAPTGLYLVAVGYNGKDQSITT